MRKDICVLFDCDGTIVNSLNHGWGSWEYAFERINLKFPDPDDIKKFFGMSADKIFMNLLDNHDKAQIAFEHYCAHEKKHVARVTIFDGMLELLSELKMNQIPTGIITGRHHRDLGHILDHHRLHGYFDVIITDDSLSHPKPHPEGLLKALRMIGVSPSSTFYIGDSVMDMKAAKAAGISPIAALWDHLARTGELERETPVLSASHPRDILQFFRELK